MKMMKGDIATVSGIITDIQHDLITIQTKAGTEINITPLDIHTIRPWYHTAEIADGVVITTTNEEVLNG